MKVNYFLKLFLLLLITGCSSAPSKWENINEEGAFLVYRRQSLIGEESYSITSNEDYIIVKSLQGENERGRITGVQAELHLKMDLTPTYYQNRRLTDKDTIINLKVETKVDSIFVWEANQKPSIIKNTDYFPIHSDIPAAMEMMLYHYYFEKGNMKNIPTLPRGEISINFIQNDTLEIKCKKVPLERYVVEGINCGGRTIWLDESKNLVALVKANTQIRELIKKGYEEAKPFFVQGNVEEQMAALSKYTKDLKGEQAKIKALVGGDIVDGLSDIAQKDMTLIIENGRITKIGKRAEVEIPVNAKVIDVSGKTLMPGLWDMHAH